MHKVWYLNSAAIIVRVLMWKI